MNDLISRQQAITALTFAKETSEMKCGELSSVFKVLNRLPSVQKEIICCKDCRYYDHEGMQCLDIYGYGRRWEENDWCSYAERREDG